MSSRRWGLAPLLTAVVLAACGSGDDGGDSAELTGVVRDPAPVVSENTVPSLSDPGTEVEFVRFPGEGHELSRSGKPRHRRERFEIILEWHARHLAAIPDDLPR